MSQELISKSMNLPVPVDSLGTYIQHVNSIAMLSADEERELALRLHQQQDLDAARQLILAHLRFVVRIARGYLGYGLPLADLIQEGNIGLMKAVKRFDPEYGVRLASFAVHWIRAEIHEFILRNWRIVKIATTKAQRKLFFNLRGAKKHLGWLNPDEVDTVARDLGVKADTLVDMESRLSGHDISFDPYPALEDDEEPYNPAPANYLDAHTDPGSLVEGEDWEEQAHTRLADALADLDPRSRNIIQRRWLNEQKPTLHELAAEYGVSAERIRQLENNALKKLKTRLALT
jgi:RNA polymerase sigma-32 factor